MRNKALGTENYFDSYPLIGIIGHGETIENAFTDAAKVMFALMVNVDEVHLSSIINFEFNADDIEEALVIWLNLLMEKGKEHHLAFGDFRLLRVGNHWKATVSGEPTRTSLERGIIVKSATKTSATVKKIEHFWEARCTLEVE